MQRVGADVSDSRSGRSLTTATFRPLRRPRPGVQSRLGAGGHGAADADCCPPEAGATHTGNYGKSTKPAPTPEARWVKALDKAETILQHNQGANPAGFRLRIQPDLWRGVVPRRCAPAPTAPPARRRDGPARRTLTECFFRNEIPCALPDGPSGQALSIFTTSACGSSAPKTLLPATSTSAPAP